MNELKANKLRDKAKLLSKKLTACRSVKRLLKQKAWGDIIQPTLDKMIDDVIGGKTGNFYTRNNLANPNEIVNTDYYIGYKQALMDFNNRIWNYPESIELLKTQITNLERTIQQPEKYTQPMQGGKYA